jgi:hypothetical protein
MTLHVTGKSDNRRSFAISVWLVLFCGLAISVSPAAAQIVAPLPDDPSSVSSSSPAGAGDDWTSDKRKGDDILDTDVDQFGQGRRCGSLHGGRGQLGHADRPSLRVYWHRRRFDPGRPRRLRKHYVAALGPPQ